MRIIHPRPLAGRQVEMGLDFVDGVATVESLHPERELALLQHGYTVEADTEVATPYQAELGDEIVDLNSLTIPELRDIAETEGVDIPAKAKKDDIVALLAAKSSPIPGATQNEDGSWTIAGIPIADGAETDGPFATVTVPDGTVTGDGTSSATAVATEPAPGLQTFED